MGIGAILLGLKNSMTLLVGLSFGNKLTQHQIIYNMSLALSQVVEALPTYAPAKVATVNVVNQTAAIAATGIAGVTTTGLYQINWVATINRAATTSSVLGGLTGYQIRYTDGNDSIVKTSAMSVINSIANSTGTSISGSFICYVLGGSTINHLMGYTSVGVALMRYDLNVSIIKL